MSDDELKSKTSFIHLKQLGPDVISASGHCKLVQLFNENGSRDINRFVPLLSMQNVVQKSVSGHRAPSKNYTVRIISLTDSALSTPPSWMGQDPLKPTAGHLNHT